MIRAIARDSAADFSSYLRVNPIATEYGMLAEYLTGGRGAPVGVHAYLMNEKGTCAYAVLLNSHHAVFNDVDPETIDDCTTILLNQLRQDLVEGE